MQPLDHSQAHSLYAVWQKVAQVFPDTPALVDPANNVTLTYQEMFEQITAFGVGLRSLGVQPQDKVALIADNSSRWFIADQGILAIGAVDVTRSSQAERQELLFILENSESTTLVIEDLATLDRLQPELDGLPITRIILLSDQTDRQDIVTFSQILAKSTGQDLGSPPTDRQTLATLIYTSGTGGNPKGVMLTHGNFLYEIVAALDVAHPQPQYRVLSILPTWHSYERTFEYFILSQGCTQIYSSIRTLKKDLRQYKPHYMVAVPRLWESIYEGIQKSLGEMPTQKQKLVQFFLSVSQHYIMAKRTAQGINIQNLQPSFWQRAWAAITATALAGLHQVADRIVYQQIREATGGEAKFWVSGGGSIAEHLEDFFEIIGIEILGGYGLTETAPITHVRRQSRNLRGGDGQPLPHTETRIIHPESGQELPFYKTGLVMIRGPQVMKGYYNNPQSTAKVIDSQGWFNTGDLGWVTPQNDLVITGRAKDTIVLTNGENIEPQPIEDACLRSPYLDQIVLVGQDQKQLGALLVPNLTVLVAEKRLSADLKLHEITDILHNNTEIVHLFKAELNREVKNRPGYRPDDRIMVFRFVPEAFSIENGTMTQTLKIKRNVVAERYRLLIEEMYGS